MKQITEDYCSFETAKLLKEKGFNYPCRAVYSPKGTVRHYLKEEVSAHNLKGHKKLCPTIQIAMRWLREDKKILISIFCHIDKGYWFCIQHFINSPYKFATSESIHRKEEILGKIQYYDTYEEAVEAALKYSLENLI
jgi:hypothetical protein